MAWQALAAPLIGGIGNIIGGIFGRKSAKKERRRAEAFERQRIQMTAADAKAAGIHPLAALGAATTYQNPYMGAGLSQSAGVAEGVSSLFESFGDGLDAHFRTDEAARDREANAAARDAEFKLREREAINNERLTNANIRRMEAEVKMMESEARRVTRENQMRARIQNGPKTDTTDPKKAVDVLVPIRDPVTGTTSLGTPSDAPDIEQMIANQIRLGHLRAKRKREVEFKQKHVDKYHGGNRAPSAEVFKLIRRKNDPGRRHRGNWKGH